MTYSYTAANWVIIGVDDDGLSLILHHTLTRTTAELLPIQFEPLGPNSKVFCIVSNFLVCIVPENALERLAYKMTNIFSDINVSINPAILYFQMTFNCYFILSVIDLTSTLISAWINNSILYKVWQESIYPLPNLNRWNRETVEAQEWISNFNAHFTGYVITFSCWD